MEEIYLDRRIVVSGLKSIIKLDNPFNLNAHIKSIVTSMGGGGTPGAYTFENGLQMIPTDTIQLGGSLIQHTNIDGDASTGVGGLHQMWFTNLDTFYAQANGAGGLPYTGNSYQLALNKSTSISFPINGVDSASLTYNDTAGYGAGFLLTSDSSAPRPYIISEMNYGGGAARTAKVEFSNDYLLSSHKIYDISNPTSVYREYLTRLGDNQLTLESINADSTNPSDIASNIVNGIELSPTGIKFYSSSTTGTPLFEYTFPITSLTKPMSQMGYSMVINSTGVNFDFVKDIKTLSCSLFDVAQTVVAKRIRLAVPFRNHILESITVCQPNGGGTLNLKVTKAGQSQDITVNASNGSSNHVFTTISNPVSGTSEFVEIEVNAISNPAMTQLSVTLNFLYAG